MPLLLSSCMGTRYLQEGESILYSQRISGNKRVPSEDLDNLYRQEPNSRLFLLPFTPYVWFYENGKKRYDREALQEERNYWKNYYDSAEIAAVGNVRLIKKLQRRRRKKLNKLDKELSEGNLFMRWGEPLSVYDPNQATYTAQQMQQYLFNRGYFQAKATFTAKTKRKRTRVTYRIAEGEPYVIDSMALITEDTALAKVIERNTAQSLIRLGDNYDAEVLEKERNRIDQLLKDNGYYTFSRNYIYFEADTSLLGNRKVLLRTVIQTPEGKNSHRVYRIDSVIITTDANTDGSGVRQREVVNGLVYQYYEAQYAKRILGRRIFLSPDSLYSRSNTLATQRQLANLDNFKFINIKYDTLAGGFVARVYMSPLPKRQISDEIGFVVSQGLPGPLINVTFTNRNIFKHLENLQMSGRFSIEGVPGVIQEGQDEVPIGRSTEFSTNLSLVLPQFLMPGKEDFRRRLGYVNPRTRAQIGYAFNSRPQYTRSTLNAGLIYTWETLRGTRYSFSLIDLSLINSQIEDESFQKFLDTLAANGNSLRRTFQPSLVSSSQIAATYNFLGKKTSQRQAAYLRVLLDVGGSIWNVINPELIKPLEYFQYIKVNADFIRYHPLHEGTVLAYRFNVGLAGSYADNNILPFEKYFFAGGSNSLRAWRPRRLGPGSYRQEDSNGNILFQFDQQGEILLASSVELRQKLFGFVDGALFVDVGNTWMFQADESRPGAQFQFNRFWREFAVGIGAGIRADFNFLVLRVDLGVKAHDPAFPVGKRWFPSEYGYDQLPGTSNEAYVINLGIGFPF